MARKISIKNGTGMHQKWIARKWLKSVLKLNSGSLHFWSDCRLGDGCILDFDGDGNTFGGTIQLGRRVTISHMAVLSPYGGAINIGNDVFIGPQALIYGHGGVDIGNDVLIAGHTKIIAANHNYSDASLLIKEQGESRLGIRIENDVWIGAGVSILDGVSIKTGTVVAAGAVVTKSVGPRTVVGGIPAKQLFDR